MASSPNDDPSPIEPGDPDAAPFAVRAGEQQTRIISTLRKGIAAGHVVVIVGSGVSVAATGGAECASWRGLIHNGVEALEIRGVETGPIHAALDDDEPRRLIEAAELLQEGLVGVAYFDSWLSETIGALEIQDDQVLRALGRLEVPLATTNYDNLIADALGFTSRAVTWRDISSFGPWIRGERRSVFHLHGHYQDSASVILGIDDYTRKGGDEPSLAQLRALLLTKSLLFVGCGDAGLSDPHFEALRTWLRDVYKGQTGTRHYRIVTKGELEAARKLHRGESFDILAIERLKDLPAFLEGLGPTRPAFEVPAAGPPPRADADADVLQAQAYDKDVAFTLHQARVPPARGGTGPAATSRSGRTKGRRFGAAALLAVFLLTLLVVGAFAWPGWLAERTATPPERDLPKAPTWATVLEERPDPKVVTDAEGRRRMEATGLPWRVKDRFDIEYVLIPPGIFLRGSLEREEGSGPDERPQHQVTLKAFYLGRYEVTQGQWTAVMGNNPSHFSDPGSGGHRDRLPVEKVSHIMIAGEDGTGGEDTFLGKTGSRLPTEAEWEYACRAGTTTPFSFGQTISTDQANYDGNYTYGPGRKGRYLERTTVVGSYPGNPWGLHDMHGNVWEWCADWYGESAYAAWTDGVDDPVGPSVGSLRVLRGGSSFYDPVYLRSASRLSVTPSAVDDVAGFRVARAP